MRDEAIICKQCEAPFIFTNAEQERFLALGYDPPKRCPECRRRKSRRDETNQKYRNKGKRRHGRRDDERMPYER
jgi:hypothetical protein